MHDALERSADSLSAFPAAHARPRRGRSWRAFADAGIELGAALAAALLLTGCAIGALLLASKVLPAFSWRFVVDDIADAGRSGGIGPVLVSTVLLVGLAVLVSLPISFGAAAYLGGAFGPPGRLGAALRAGTDAMVGLPSIVVGLLGNALFCKALGLGFSIVSGALTLAFMILPFSIHLGTEGFRAIKPEIWQAAGALALSRVTTIRRIALPLVAPYLATGAAMAVARASAETAALVFTSGYAARMPTSLSDSGRSLSVHIYDLAMNVPGGDDNAYRSVFVLVLAVLATDRLAAWLFSTRRNHV